MKRDIRIEAEYPHPPEKVWLALTDSKLLARWLMQNDFEPRLGHRFSFRMKPQPGFDGIVRCEVLELDAPRRLRYGWCGGPLRSEVAFTLTPTPAGTRLTLHHTGFEGLKAVLLSFMMGGGWGKMLRKRIPGVLATLDATGEVAEAPTHKCDVLWGQKVYGHLLRLIPRRG